MVRIKDVLLLGMISVLPPCVKAAAAEMAPHHHEAAAANCADPGLACATVATPLFAKDGSLWLVWGAAGMVSVARSHDLGGHFTTPILITPQPGRLDAAGDGRPVMIQDSRGDLIVAYANFKDDAWNSELLISTSKDDGASFSAPHPITDDPASQRFPALAADGSGHIFAAWIDKRTIAADRAHGKARPGAAIAYAWSGDGGESFDASHILWDGSCECCRLGLAINREGLPLLLFRSLFDGGIRDHALIAFADRTSPLPPVRPSVDNWAIDGCPHHGPSLAVAPSGTIHAVWFTQGPIRQGAFYARSTDGGKNFGPPMALGAPERHGARPFVLAAHGKIWVSWKEFDGKTTSVAAMVSGDDGRSWSEPFVAAQTAFGSDHPYLLADDRSVYLSWLTQAEGYRLIPLENGQ